METTIEKQTAPRARPTAEQRYDLIVQAIEEIRPQLKADGGDLELLGVEGDMVTVRLTGACVGCQLSGATINGVQERLIAVLGFPLRVVTPPPGPSRPVSIAPRL